MSYEALLGRCSIRGRAADGRVSCVQICPPKISWLSSSSRVSSHFRLINQVLSRSPSLPCLLPLSLSLSLRCRRKSQDCQKRRRVDDEAGGMGMGGYVGSEDSHRGYSGA